MSDMGDTTDLFACSSDQFARIDKLSLPTGMAMPSAGQSASPTAYTASNNAWSSLSSPQAAIQFADKVMSDSLAIFAPAILVMASATARRADAAGLIKATGVRSPILMASPVIGLPSTGMRAEAVTAQSATGTW